MSQTFSLKKGEISFNDDKTIVITDKAKLQRYMTLSSSVIWILLGIINALKFGQSGDESFQWFWIVLGILNLLIFIVTLSRSARSIISLDDVKSIEVKQRFSNTMLDIKLKSNRLRRVIQIEDTEELKEYIEANF